MIGERNMIGARYMRPRKQSPGLGMALYVIGLIVTFVMLGAWVEWGLSINPNIAH